MIKKNIWLFLIGATCIITAKVINAYYNEGFAGSLIHPLYIASGVFNLIYVARMGRAFGKRYKGESIT